MIARVLPSAKISGFQLWELMIKSWKFRKSGSYCFHVPAAEPPDITIIDSEELLSP